jgi:hypothetical protein
MLPAHLSNYELQFAQVVPRSSRPAAMSGSSNEVLAITMEQARNECTMVELSQEAAKSLAQLWRWLRWRTMLLWILIPGVFLFSWTTETFHRRWLLIAYVSAWLTSFVFVRRRARTWPCPFCGKPVLQRRDFYSNFSSECLHCGKSLKPSLV